MNHRRFLGMILAMGLAIGAVATAMAGSSQLEPPIVVAPTPPPSSACPPIDIPPLGPGDEGAPGRTQGPVATLLPLPSFIAAPSVGPEPCPSPVPGPIGGDPLGRLPGGFASPMPVLIPVGPMPTPPR